MKSRLLRTLTSLPLAGLLLFQPGVGNVQANVPGIDDEMNDIQARLLSGFAALEFSPKDNGGGAKAISYSPRGRDACPTNQSSNIKVNQNCLNLTDPDLQGRGQAQNEESIAADPNQPNHLVASYNDYRRGDGTCGVSYSLDKGRTWNDATTPNNFTRNPTAPPPREYWQAGGDTSVGWDSKGNAYLSCQLFKRGPATSPDPDRASGFFVFRSTQNNGASFNFPGRPVFQTGPQTTFLPLEDKQFMGIDNNVTACASGTATATPGASCTPFQDRIYVTWTEFAPLPTRTAFIYEAYSSDYGEHFSPRHLVSTNSPLCPNSYGISPSNTCNENQFSQPFVGSDGVLYVIFNNFNNAETISGPDNRNQILMARSLDGGQTFTSLVKVSDYYDLPDCATYQGGHDFGRACVPEKAATNNSIFRASNYGSGAVNPTNPGQVVVTFGSYINQHSNESNGCVPTGTSPTTGQNRFTGVKTPGACNNDILISVSGDGGQTFTGTTTDPRALTTVNTDAGQATTDQWWQWIAFTKNGKLATSYYDRQYGDDEATGYSDFSLSGTGNAGGTSFGVSRVSSSSMPFPTQFPEGGGSAGSVFWGDYTGLTAVDNAYPFWSDTRDPDLFVCRDTAGNVALPPSVCGGITLGTTLNDQNAYTAAVSVPAK